MGMLHECVNVTCSVEVLYKYSPFTILTVNKFFGGSFSERTNLNPTFPFETRKRVKALEVLMGLIQNSHLDDPQSMKLQDNTEKLRAKFRQVLDSVCLQQI